ncbi:MAG: PAS domain S-box protein [Sulfuriferula sp.]|nr:PAS domain S-box protein [Sulfuriferula sp.]
MAKWHFYFKQGRFPLRLFLLFWIPLTLVLVAIILAFYNVQANSALTLVKAAERQAVRLSFQASTMGLSTVRSDLLYLADLTELQKFSAMDADAEREALAGEFLALVSRKGIYDQLRLLDENGREIIRVNNNNGHPVIVKRTALQNKSQQYYVRDAFALARGEVYVSPLDLHVEQGVIEQPIKPMIRFATPVFDREGHKRGVIVLNYLGQQLLNRIRKVSSYERLEGSIWLLNASGYWLLGPYSADEWGFMYPHRLDKRLDVRDADAWRQIREGKHTGQFMTGQGMYTYAKVSDLTLGRQRNEPRVVTTDQWVLVAYEPAAYLAAKNGGLTDRLWVVFGVLEFMLTVVAWAIVYYSVKRRVAEESVRASEARFRGLLESAPDAIIIVDRDGRILLANAQTEKYFGYMRDELLQQPVEILVPDHLRAAHPQHRADFHANPHLRPMGEGLDLYGRRKDGSEFPVEISLSPTQTPQGTIVTAIIRDITSRKLAEHLRQEAQERYRDLVNNLPVGIYRNTAGEPGRFVEVNPAMASMFEAASVEAFLQYSFSALYRDPMQYHALNDKILRQGFVTTEEVELVTSSGRNFWAAVTAVMKTDADGEVYFDGVIEDISGRKESQRQLQLLNDSLSKRSVELEAANQELEAFSYSVSHDLRAPLRAIDGFSRILHSDYAPQLGGIGQDYLERIRRAAQHMGMLIDDLLKLSRVTRSELVQEEVDLSELANEIMVELGKQEPERVVHFILQPGLKVRCDRRLMRVVLDNLFSNAWKFTGKLDVAEIEFGSIMQDGESVYFVRDNGAGFDMAYADKLFGVFQRLHDAGDFPGTGVGLATVQRIIHKHGGRVWADARVDGGAMFYFTLSTEMPS